MADMEKNTFWKKYFPSLDDVRASKTAPLGWPYSKTSQNATRNLIGRKLAVFSVGTLAKLYLSLNKSKIHNGEALFSRIRDRSRPLVTICNHTSNLDDPIMWGFLPTDILSQPKLMRWSWAAKEVCFMKPSFSRFFGFGQAIPVVRGAGLNQFGVDFAVERLKNNEWVHVFAEGRVNQRKKIVPFRWGVSELIFRACMQENVMISPIPTIIPLYLYGMWEAQPGGDTTLNPNNKWTLPRFNKTIELFVGQEIDVQDLVSRAKSVGIKQARADITLRIQEVVEEMELLAFAKLNNPLFPQITIETLPSKSLVASEVAATVDHALEATKQALAVKQGIKSPNEII